MRPVFFSKLTLLGATAVVYPSLVQADCRAGFTICAPPDATTDTTPVIGDASFVDLFTNIVRSSLPSWSKRHSPISARAGASLCCISSLSCLTIVNLAIPFCYDPFTTNYYLPDNSYGTVVGGAYNGSNGDVANLQTGEYTRVNGERGNIYSVNPEKRPNTATLALPSQYTASGVGSAIAASGLGGEITLTYTTTYPGTLVSATTIQRSTVEQVVVTQEVVLTTTTGTARLLVTTLVEETLAGTTIAETTKGAQTLAPDVRIVTTVEPGTSSASASNSQISSTSASATENAARGVRGVMCWSLQWLVPFFAILL